MRPSFAATRASDGITARGRPNAVQQKNRLSSTAQGCWPLHRQRCGYASRWRGASANAQPVTRSRIVGRIASGQICTAEQSAVSLYVPIPMHRQQRADLSAFPENPKTCFPSSNIPFAGIKKRARAGRCDRLPSEPVTANSAAPCDALPRVILWGERPMPALTTDESVTQIRTS